MIEETKQQATLTDIWQCPRLSKQTPVCESLWCFHRLYHSRWSILSPPPIQKNTFPSSLPFPSSVLGHIIGLNLTHSNYTVKHNSCVTSSNITPGEVTWMEKRANAVQIVKVAFMNEVWFSVLMSCNHCCFKLILCNNYAVIASYLLLHRWHQHIVFIPTCPFFSVFFSCFSAALVW